MVVIGNALKPVVQAWWSKARISGGTTTIMLILGIGLGAWAIGRAQSDGGPGPGGGTNVPPGGHSGAFPGAHSSGHSHTHSNGYTNGHAGGPPPPPPQSGPSPHSHSGPPPNTRPMPEDYAESPPKSRWEQAPPTPEPKPEPQWQQTPPPPTPEPKPQPQAQPQPQANNAKGAWEKAREETRRKEEERKAKEAEKKRREELDKKIKEMREKEAREREAREKKKKEDDDKVAAAKRAEDRVKELAAIRAKLAEKKAAEAAKKAATEKDAAVKKLAEELIAKRAAAEKEAAAKKLAEQAASKPPPSTYAFSSVGERMSPWPNGRPPSPKPKAQPPPPSPRKPPPPPTAKTFLGTDDDSYSYRPYDKPKRPTHAKSPSSIYSESSYASQTTSRTTPPPSQRAPYSTKDPDKIQIKAVYAFTNAFVKTPTSQLISGVGSVTDGLILRITTEGLFIDDDVRGVPQREWDVKAWTMNLVEVWCPSFRQDSAGNARASTSSPSASNKTFRRLWGLDKDKPASSEETDALLNNMLQLCKDNCRLRAANSRPSDARSYATSSVYSASSAASSDRDSVFSADERANRRGAQTGENKNARLHVLRASIRDQEGKKYVFVITEEESWKVSVGLQKLRRGRQGKAFGTLGVSGMTAADAKGTLQHLGWG